MNIILRHIDIPQPDFLAAFYARAERDVGIFFGPSSLLNDVFDILAMISVILARPDKSVEHFSFAIDIGHLHDALDVIGNARAS